jgi:hypothetical protein
MNALNLVGQVFNKLTIVSRAENHISKGGRVSSAFNCLCSCGGATTATGDNLKRGKVGSCGCIPKGTPPVSPIILAERKELKKATEQALVLAKHKAAKDTLESDTLAGLCKPLVECNQYYLYQDGRLFSLRSMKYLKVDWDHGDYKQTTEGFLRWRRNPMYTIVLGTGTDELTEACSEANKQLRFTIASKLLKIFGRQPINGERAWRKDWLRNPKKTPTLNEIEWVNTTEHARRSAKLTKLATITAGQRRYHIRKWDQERLNRLQLHCN